jgi:uncharacterized repeat protein (TIGR02543 family)
MPVDAEDPDKPAEIGEVALSDGEYILGIKTGDFAADKYTVRVYDLDLDGDNNPDTPIAEKPEWPLGVARRAVTFELDGGSLSGANTQIVNAGESVTRPAPDPDKEGYTFAGWYSEETLGTLYDFSSPVNTNIRVWAKWAAISGPSGPPPEAEMIQVTASGVTVTGTLSSGSNISGVFIDDRTVTLNQYKMAKDETTWELWNAVAQQTTANGYSLTGGSGYQGHEPYGTSPPTGTGNGPDAEKRPVTWVSWRDAIVWCNLYSELSGLQPVYTYNGNVIKDATDATCDNAVMDKTRTGFRLPTEAEWEFAARGGDPNESGWLRPYSCSSNLIYVWYDANAGSEVGSDNAAYGVHPAGSGTGFSPAPDNTLNELGLRDMTGNVFEWCWDWYGGITTGTSEDGAASGWNRVYRGGAWNSAVPGGGVNAAHALRVNNRDNGLPDTRTNNIGFRLVRR